MDRAHFFGYFRIRAVHWMNVKFLSAVYTQKRDPFYHPAFISLLHGICSLSCSQLSNSSLYIAETFLASSERFPLIIIRITSIEDVRRFYYNRDPYNTFIHHRCITYSYLLLKRTETARSKAVECSILIQRTNTRVAFNDFLSPNQKRYSR